MLISNHWKKHSMHWSFFLLQDKTSHLSTQALSMIATTVMLKSCSNRKDFHLVTYIFNIFSQFANASKNPTNLRELKVNNAIDKSLFEIPVYMSVELIRNLRLTKITTQLGNLFTTPTLTYSLFFPKTLSMRYCREFLDASIIQLSSQVITRHQIIMYFLLINL